MYILNTGEITSGASKVFADLFNAVTSGSRVIVSGIYIKPKSDVAVTGVVSPKFGFYLTTAIGASGQNVAYASSSATAASIIPLNSEQAPLPTGITARTSPTAGATIAVRLASTFAISEETNADATAQQYRNVLKQGTEIVLNPGQGLVVKQGSVASVNDYEFEIYFTVEETE
jgi:hypothetical protein